MSQYRDEWNPVNLRELVENFDQHRRPIKSMDRVAGATPYYGASGIIDYVEGYTHDGEFLLVAEDGENLRTRATPIAFMASGRFWANNHAHVLAGNDRALSRFLCYLLSITDISGYLTGTTQPKLSRSSLDLIRLSVPTINTQLAIVEVLGALDAKIAANRKLTSTADQLADARFAMSTVATQADPLGHNMVTIGELGKLGAITYGDGYRTKRSELADEGFRILRVADVFGGEIHLDSTDFVEYGRRTAIGAKAAQVGDIVLTTKGTVGRLAVFEGSGEDVVYSPQVCFFRVGQNDIVERSYLRRWFSSPSFISQASYRKGNTDMADYINLSDIGSLAISLPNIESQRALGEILEPLDAMVAALRKESRYLVALRDTLIPRLMAGELRVRDAEKAVENVL